MSAAPDTRPVHSEIGASSMHRWAVCPGSVRLSRGVPNKSSSYAEEGTRAHNIAAYILQKGHWPVGIPHLGVEKPEMDEEMRDGINVYLDECRRDVVPGIQVLTEHAFDLTRLYKGLYGTCDRIVYFPPQKLLRVIDFKYGAGIPVEVVEDGKPNVQLLYYGLGALLTLDLPVDMVELVIVQPRCHHKDGPVRRHSFPAIEMLDFAADLVECAIKTEDPNAAIVPGDHCRFCPAGSAGKCPALANKAQSLAKVAFANTQTEGYDQVKLAELLTWLPVLKGWAKNLEEFAESEALAGRCPPGFKLVQKTGRRQWKSDNEGEIVEELRAALKLPADHFYDHSLKSPAQVEKMAGKAAKPKVAELVVTVSSGLTLVSESDKRPPARESIETAFTEVAVDTASAKEVSIFD